MTETVRYTIDIDPTAREELAAMATQYKLTQGEVIEVMLAFVRQADQMAPAMQTKREAKVADREKRRKLMATLRNMSPEQLAELNAIAQAKAPA
jgi:predicted GIY-YIG superfamily endonuclease